MFEQMSLALRPIFFRLLSRNYNLCTSDVLGMRKNWNHYSVSRTIQFQNSKINFSCTVFHINIVRGPCDGRSSRVRNVNVDAARATSSKFVKSIFEMDVRTSQNAAQNQSVACAAQVVTLLELRRRTQPK